jgi:hypothetical protein
MNYGHIALASLGATVAYFVYGFALFAAWPSMKVEFKKYPGVYRSEESMMKVMPLGMVGILVSIVIVAMVYAKSYPAGGGIVPGLCVGALVGGFVLCMFVLHNYVNLNIGVKLTVYQAIAYFFQWLIVGAAIGAIYKPS